MTSSDRLSIEEEYENQISWQESNDSKYNINNDIIDINDLYNK